MPISLRGVVRAFATAPLAQRALLLAGRTRPGFRLLNRLSGTRCVYASFGEAWEACRRRREPSYEHNEPLHNVFLELPPRPSDYPALVHFAAIGSGRAFEFGSSVGNVYYLYRRLSRGWSWEWTGYDLPDVVRSGRDIARERGEKDLAFTTDLAAGRGCDVVLFSGSLHYWEDSIAEFFRRLGSLPPHVIVNRSPLRRRGANVVVIQRERGSYAFPCLVRSREGLTAEFADLGYELVDDWTEPGLSYVMPLLPEYSVPAYSGFYFRRTAEKRQTSESEREPVREANLSGARARSVIEGTPRPRPARAAETHRNRRSSADTR